MKYLDKKSGYDPDIKRVWTVPMIVVVPASGICRGKRALTRDFSQTHSLHRASQLESGSRVWHMDHRPRDKQGCCAGNISDGKVAGRKEEVEPNANSPLALLVNPYAETILKKNQKKPNSAEASRALLQSRQQQNTTTSDASSLIVQTEWQNENEKL